jgi:hypothetical protein
MMRPRPILEKVLVLIAAFGAAYLVTLLFMKFFS